MGVLNKPTTETIELGGRELSIETGRLAKQAHGSVFIKYGETAALVTAVAPSKETDLDFLPMTIEFQEKFYAAGRIPGGFFKKEARPSEWATLNARMVDRPIRPLWPQGYNCPVQIVITLLSYDGENEVEAISCLGASASLLLSDAPFDTAVASVRVGRINGDFIVNPTPSQLELSDLNVLISGSEDSIMMVEGDCKNVAEDEFLEAVYFAHDNIKVLIKMQRTLQEKCGKTKREFVVPKLDPDLLDTIKSKSISDIKNAFSETEKEKRYALLDEAKAKLIEEYNEKITEDETFKDQIKKCFNEVKKKYARDFTLEGKRIDGREFNQVRPIETEVSVLPRTHGSALFTRGETQAIVTITLGTADDEQMLDGVKGKSFKHFLLHYTFPPYCVGETGRFGGNSRREIGHGNLAERAIKSVMPNHDDFPYTIRVASEVLESNGSSSMATVCGGILALMDAGVPVKEPVAGIAMGLIKEGDKTCVLSDILGDEDHLGDMDFKVCGTKAGITAVQMDIKMTGIDKETMKSALYQAKEGRLHILEKMAETIKASREELSMHAPRIETIKLPEDKVGAVIGPGGKNIKNIIAVSGCKVEIDDNGVANLASSDADSIAKAREMIEQLIQEPEVGKTYQGTVKKIMDFGAFVEIFPGKEGLCHISELDHRRVENVTDVLAEGDEVAVKLLDIDRQGRLKLSRKELIEKPA